MDRRGFLKAFGIGAIAVPVVGGVPKLEHTARILYPPRVELVTPEPLSISSLPPFDAAGEVQLTISMIDKKNGKRYEFAADSVIIGYEYSPMYAMHSDFGGSEMREFVPGVRQIKYTIHGVVTGPPRKYLDPGKIR